MDREIPKEVLKKERNKRFMKYGSIGAAIVVCMALLISFMQSSVKRRDIVFSTVDSGTIEVSVSASGKVVPAFEESSTRPSTAESSRLTARVATVWMWAHRF